MKTNHLIFLFVIVFLVLGLLSFAGCDMGDMIHVKTPNTIQQQTGLASTITLNEAESEYQSWYQHMQTAGSQWKSNIEHANEIRNMVNQLSLSALDQVGPTVAGVPMLGPLLPAASGLLGLFLGSTKLRKEKEDSFNKGLDEGRKTTTVSSGIVATA
jgi:predicted PurR-regulated permease PerM